MSDPSGATALRNTIAVFEHTVVDVHGDLVPFATVEVRDSDGGLAVLYGAWDGAFSLTSPLGNPYTLGADAHIRFYTRSGPCRVSVSGDDFTRVWEHVALGNLPQVQQENIFTAPQFIALNTPQLWLYVSNAEVDNHYWLFGANAEGLAIGTSNDAATSLGHGIVMQREAEIVTQLVLKARDQIVIQGPVLIDQGIAVISGASASLRLFETDVGDDTGKWDFTADGGTLTLTSITDSGDDARTIFKAIRTGTGADLLSALYINFNGTGLVSISGPLYIGATGGDAVSYGAPNSGGSGFRLVRVPN